MSGDDYTCWKCAGEGVYCWTCGEPPDACECDEDARNIGACDHCDGMGVGGRNPGMTGADDEQA